MKSHLAMQLQNNHCGSTSEYKTFITIYLQCQRANTLEMYVGSLKGKMSQYCDELVIKDSVMSTGELKLTTPCDFGH